jgi:N-acetylmuramoyl-L-alanine amidase
MNEDVAFPPSPRRPRRAAPVDPTQDETVPGPVSSADQGSKSVGNGGKNQRRSAGSSKSDFSAWKSLSSVFSVALVVATLFTLWTPDNLFSNVLLDRMFQAVQPPPVEQIRVTSTPSPRPHIGIVAGHWGNDSGSVCADGLTEESINLKIATLVQRTLSQEGYDVDLFKEFDPRLTEYRALALLSIHNDSCDFINAEATGFKVAAAASSVFPEKATRLTACLSQRYAAITGLTFHYNTVTRDMTEYHAFSEIHNETTAAIIETGFLNLDREILTKHTDRVAQGVASGILCFVRNEDIPQVPTLSP